MKEEASPSSEFECDKKLGLQYGGTGNFFLPREVTLDQIALDKLELRPVTISISCLP
jgi:hypothetical protein